MNCRECSIEIIVDNIGLFEKYEDVVLACVCYECHNMFERPEVEISNDQILEDITITKPLKYNSVLMSQEVIKDYVDNNLYDSMKANYMLHYTANTTSTSNLYSITAS